LIDYVDNKELSEKLSTLNIDFKKPTIFINDFFGMLPHFSIKILQDNLLNYYIEKFYTENLIEEGCCKICNSTENLTQNFYYSEDRTEPSHVFSLSDKYNIMESGEKKKQSFINQSFYICDKCDEVLGKKTDIISNNKLWFIKVGIDNLNQKSQLYSHMSEIVSEKQELSERCSFYKIYRDDLNNNLNINLMFLTNSTSNLFFNFNILQKFFRYPLYSSEKDKNKDRNNKPLSNWLDNIYSDLSKKKETFDYEKVSFIQHNNKKLYDFWLTSKPLDSRFIDKIINFFIKYRYSEKCIGKINILGYFKNIFSIVDTLKDNDSKKYKSDELIDVLENGKYKKYVINRKTVIDSLLQYKEGESMFDRHVAINEKLRVLDNIENELDEIKLDLSDDELWTIIGRVVGYLQSFNLSENKKTMDYLNMIQTFNNKNVIKLLETSFFKYSYKINHNQAKFKLIYDLITSKLVSKDIKIDSLSKTMFISGIMNGQIIKLNKNK